MSENVQVMIRRLEENLVAAADDVALRGRLAEAYLRIGDKKNAGQQYKEIGRLRLHRMQLERGAAAFKAAAQYLPNDLTVQEQLYTIYRLTDHHAESVEVGTLLADQLRRARQFGRAEEILMRCLQVGGDKPEVRRVLAETYVGMGAPAKARPHLKHLAENHPDERERRKCAQLLADLDRKASTPAAGDAKATTAKAAAGGDGAGPAKAGWIAAAVLVMLVGGAGINHQLAAQSRAGAMTEAAALAADGDLSAAADRLRAAGMDAAAGQADQTAAAAQARSERAELAVAATQGLAPSADGGPTGLDTAQRLAKSAHANDVQRAAASLAADLDRAGADADRLRRALNAADPSGAFAAWRALRDGGRLGGVLAATPDLAVGEISIELTTTPSGAVVSAGGVDLGSTPCRVRFPIGAGRVVTLTAGELVARVDCRETPGASWPVRLQRAERWRVRVAGAVTGAVVAAGVVYVAGADGSLVSVDAPSGHERWRATLGPGGDLVGAPVVAGDYVVVMLGRGRTAAFTTADGTRGGPLDDLETTAPPLALDGSLLRATAAGQLIRSNPVAGANGRRHQPWGAFTGTQRLIASEEAIYAVGVTRVAAFAPRGGAPIWSRDLEQRLAGTVHEAGDWILIALADGGSAVLDLGGLPVAAGAWARTATGPAVYDGVRILFGRSAGGLGEAVEALAMQDNDALRLRKEFGAVSGITLADGVCYVAGGAGRLVSWVAPEPAPRWTARLPGAPSTAPLLDGARVLIGLRTGELIALAGEAR